MASGEKSKSKSVSFEPELWERVETKAEVRHGGNRSAYLRELAQRDLDGAMTPAPSASVIIELARVFHPTLADTLAQQLLIGENGKPVHQARTVARFLEGLSKAMEGHMNPEQPFELVTASQIEAFGAVHESNRAELTREVVRIMEEANAAIAARTKDKTYPKQKKK